ncbi:MAG: flgD [Ignavibacteria bacterium]|nr:flgD [Ignavibacteria bacterium]
MTQPISNATSVPTTQSTSSGKTSVSKDEFLKLLTMQLKQQNPLKPYDNQEFAAQLAQFSQLEQLSDIRSLMEEQVKGNIALTNTMSNSALPGMLGKTAKAYGNKISFDGTKPASIGFSSAYPAKDGKILIRDSSGAVIKTIELTGVNLKNGEHNLSWDGKDSKGNTVTAGDFTFEVKMNDVKGTPIVAQPYTFGVISAVRFKPEGTMLVINGMEVPLENVTDLSIN